MSNSQSYNSTDITILNDRDHVRLRTALYLGNTEVEKYRVPLFLNDKFEIKDFEFAFHKNKSWNEILDNAIDEHNQIKAANKKIIINANPMLGEYQIQDNGRGVPMDIHPTVNRPTPEVVFSQLRSGRNFKNGKDAGVQGQNGVGSSVTNFTSEYFNVEIDRDGKNYKQEFLNGAIKIKEPIIKKTGSNKTGTNISFKLDKDVFKDVSLPEEIIHNRAIEVALTNPDIEVEYNNNSYKFKKGFDSIINKISNNYFKFEKNNIEFYVIFDINKNEEEEVFTWVNSSLLYLGGTCNSQFINAFADKVIDHLGKYAKKNKCEIIKNDIKRKLLIIGNLKISDPSYDSQSKVRLISTNLKNSFIEIIEESWSLFARRNKQWLEDVLQYAIKRHSSKADKEALKELQNNKKKKVDGLMDCTSKDLSKRRIFITEGLSALSQLRDARNPESDAAFALTGKINNVYGAKISEVLNMGKLTNLLAAIGLVPGQKAIRSSLKFSKICISTDADTDGGSIMNLLVNLFYQFWPELFDKNYPPIIHRLVVPNICLVKGNKIIHFSSREEYEKIKNNYQGYEVRYYKGLGSMDIKDWEIILNDEKYLLPLVDDGNMKNILELIFSENIENRKTWLTK